MAALDALSRYAKGKASHLDAIAPDPHVWPTSGVIDWLNVLSRIEKVPGREKRIAEAEGILRSRMNFQGTTMGFSTERTDFLWWLMVSGDVNAVRGLLALQGRAGWKQDVPRMVRGGARAPAPGRVEHDRCQRVGRARDGEVLEGVRNGNPLGDDLGRAGGWGAPPWTGERPRKGTTSFSRGRRWKGS